MYSYQIYTFKELTMKDLRWKVVFSPLSSEMSSLNIFNLDFRIYLHVHK